MIALLWLVPIALCLGAVGLTLFFWTVKSGQYEDIKGDAARILHSEDHPIVHDDD
ncbi:MAG: cbb3-type cytochrome oxidase assembly protein CcoS [Robiginitomaculum sp.]|nr:MAG: cbb3-type cytochrome oxidase assembly protein CcoS [Robiginitomaculum sp.]